MRLTVSRTTPGVTVVWRGMFAECCPHGHLLEGVGREAAERTAALVPRNRVTNP